MLALVGVVLLTLGVVGLSIFLLGLGSLLKRRCTLRGCGTDAAEACEGCPSARSPENYPSLEV